jgi:hypothetical protein
MKFLDGGEYPVQEEKMSDRETMPVEKRLFWEKQRVLAGPVMTSGGGSDVPVSE